MLLSVLIAFLLAPPPPATAGGATQAPTTESATPTDATPTTATDLAPPDAASDDGGSEDGGVTYYQFSGLGIDGELRTPALLQFLSRIGGEFETVGIPHRSFMPELRQTVMEDAL